MPAAHDLVLVPGLNNTAEVFDGVVAALPATVRAHAVDNPPLSSVEAIAEALLAQLPPRFWLAGFSFGGYVALAMLQAAPQRVQGLALVCTGPFADTAAQAARREEVLQVVAQGRYFTLVDSQAANTFHPDSLHDAGLMERRRAMVRRYGPASYTAHVRATLARPDRMHLLDGRHPVLVVGASHDALFPPAALRDYAQRIPGARMQEVAGAGHLLPMEQPEALAAVLVDWMETAAH
jgi:pimeloyl-ACP methyl ester carboxylesterase